MMNKKRYTFNNLYNIEIEVSSLCNRKCEYCPQSLIERKRDFFPFPYFEKIMYELKEIGYSGGIAFHQFNEPLLEYDYLCQCISCAKKINPDARLELYTNGDLLTRGKLKYLKKIGIDRLVVTCHWGRGEKWSQEQAIKKVREIMKKLKIYKRKLIVTEDSVSMKESELLNYIFKLKEFGYQKIKRYPFKLQISATNYRKIGSTRMDTICITDHEKNIERDCTYYCYSLLHGLHISYKGNAYMCCDCCEDASGMERYKIGTIMDSSIFDLFERKCKLINEYIDGEIISICKGCYWNQ